MSEKDKRPVGDFMEELFKLKRIKAEHNSAIKELNIHIDIIEKKLLENLQSFGLDRISNHLGTVYISGQVVPNVVDWDAFYEYVGKTNSFHLLERRLTKTAFREMHENGEEIPGVDPVSFDEVRTRKD